MSAIKGSGQKQHLLSTGFVLEHGRNSTGDRKKVSNLYLLQESSSQKKREKKKKKKKHHLKGLAEEPGSLQENHLNNAIS